MVEEKSYILMIDDDDVDFHHLKRLLNSTGFRFELLRATDGMHALDLLKGNEKRLPIPTPKIIFLDLNMPRMNGFEFLDEIQSDEMLNHIFVVVFSSSIPVDLNEINLRIRNLEFLEKPNDTDAQVQSLVKISHYLQNFNFSKVS